MTNTRPTSRTNTQTTHTRPALMVLAAAAVVATLLAGARQASALSAMVQAPAPSRVAVVDAMRVVNALEELKTRQAEFNAAIDEAQNKLDNMQNREDAMIEDLKTMELTTSERWEREIELAQLRGQAAGTKQALQAYLATQQGNIIAELYAKVAATVADIAQREGYDLVLVDDSSINPRPDSPSDEVQQVLRTRRVLYASDQLDITDRVIAEMNALFRAG